MQDDNAIKIKMYSNFALIMGLLTFIQLFGIEKGIAAIIFGTLALTKITDSTKAKTRVFSWVGIILAIFYITFIIGFFVKNPKIVKNLQENIDNISKMINQ